MRRTAARPPPSSAVRSPYAGDLLPLGAPRQPRPARPIGRTGRHRGVCERQCACLPRRPAPARRRKRSAALTPADAPLDLTHLPAVYLYLYTCTSPVRTHLNLSTRWRATVHLPPEPTYSTVQIKPYHKTTVQEGVPHPTARRRRRHPFWFYRVPPLPPPSTWSTWTCPAFL